jgi:hypothetical protein
MSDEHEGWSTSEPIMVGAVHQPLCTYPSDPLALIARLITDVHVLRMICWYLDQVVQSRCSPDELQSEHVRAIGLVGALQQVGGALRVTRAEYNAMLARGMSVEFHHAGPNAIDFRLTMQKPEPPKRRRRASR